MLFCDKRFCSDTKSRAKWKVGLYSIIWCTRMFSYCRLLGTFLLRTTRPRSIWAWRRFSKDWLFPICTDFSPSRTCTLLFTYNSLNFHSGDVGNGDLPFALSAVEIMAANNNIKEKRKIILLILSVFLKFLTFQLSIILCYVYENVH